MVQFASVDFVIRHGDIRDRSLKLSEIAENFARFYPSPNFVWGGFPEYGDLDYKIEPTSDHMAKFHGDWLRELGDLVAK